MTFEFDLDASFGGPSPPKAEPASPLPTPDLLDKLASEVTALTATLAQIERAMCDMIDEKGIPIEGNVAESLQQLDLAVQTTTCLNDIMVHAASTEEEDGHKVEDVLQRLPLRDIAQRFRE